MSKRFFSFVSLPLILSIGAMGDILPDPDKYHTFSRDVFIDNIQSYANYKFAVLYGEDVYGYPTIKIIDDSGRVPDAPKWSNVCIVAVKKVLLDSLDTEEAAADISSSLESKNCQYFPITTTNGLIMDNKYPVARQKYHYKIKSIKNSKAVLKLYRRDIEFIDGTEISEDIK